MVRDMLLYEDPRWKEHVPECNWYLVAKKFNRADMLVNYSEIEDLIQKRIFAIKNNDSKMAEKLKKDLNKLGVVIEDTPTGIKWKKLFEEV
jgi:cysteinyl-tRNA synthetase